MFKAKLFLCLVAFDLFLLTVLQWRSGIVAAADHTLLIEKRELAAQMKLTDLALWTEARYTRHPSQTDFFSAFQDSPGSPDHFPAGSIMAPPSQFHRQ